MTQTAAEFLVDLSGRSKRKQESLRAAARVLNRKGLSASLQDVADDLGVKYTALYNHFDNREDMIVQCLLWSGALLYQAMVKSGEAGGTGRDKVLHFLREFSNVGMREGTPSGSLSVGLSPDAQMRLYQSTLPSRELLAQFIDDGVADGSIARCDSLVTASWILHTLYWWPDELQLERRRNKAAIADQILSLVDRALGGSGSD